MATAAKRRLSLSGDDDQPDTRHSQHDLTSSGDSASQPKPAKRHRRATPESSRPPSRDIVSTLSDELLIRILTHFGVREILDISRVSKRFLRLTSDSQLWRYHYWTRFVRPRAKLIPRFDMESSRKASQRLNFDGRRSIYADGGFGRSSGLVGPKDTSQNIPQTADWKGTYKMRHNWERGRCSLNELQLQNDAEWSTSPERRTYAQFVDGLAVTVDSSGHIRAWDLRSRKLLSHAFLDASERMGACPLSLALDAQQLPSGFLDIAIGFEDGTFDIWGLNVAKQTLSMRYRHQQRTFGPVISLAYMHPYVLTARKTGFIVLFSFNSAEVNSSHTDPLGRNPDSSSPVQSPRSDGGDSTLPYPEILGTVKSANTMPQAVSIRQVASSYIASVAYTFQSIGGWCIGIQDLDIKPSARRKLDAVTSRLAHTLPTPARRLGPSSSYSYRRSTPYHGGHDAESESDLSEDEDEDVGRPTRLCYSHPYLLATLPDNTLMLHLCTAKAETLSISPGIRLWGHTSSVSDAVITPWGRAVSVTARGDEMRLWKVEGGLDSGSVEVRPREQTSANSAGVNAGQNCNSDSSPQEATTNDKQTWVAFDEERVIALKEKPNGRESFMVYDFT